MRTIQIAPYREDCKIIGHSVTGTMDGRTFVFTVPDKYRMPEDEANETNEV